MKKEKVLLVEGADDLNAISGLIRSHLSWPHKNWPVFIETGGGFPDIIEPIELSARLKASGLRCFGIILDADDNFMGRWTAVRNIIKIHFPDVPSDLPNSGLILHGEIKFGVWIMPNCQSNGMLENFLAYLVPN